MTASLPSDDSQLQELNRAVAANELSQAARLAFALARRGALPILQLIGLAGMMGQAGQSAQAAELYHLWLRCTESPLLFAAWYNLGVLQIQSDEQQEAEHSLRAALAIKPDFIDARMALGTLQERLRQHEAALATWRAALANLDPDHPASRPRQIQALNSVARVAALRRQYPEAEDACARSLLLDPKQPDVAAQWVALRQRQCAWPVCAPLPGLAEADLADAASAASALCLSDDPALQLAAARRHPVNRAAAPAPLADQHGYVHRKLRVGYLACDFAGHAGARRTAGLVGLHQRAQFEIYGFSWADDERDGQRDGAAAPSTSHRLDHHIPLAGMSDLQAAQTIRAHEIDILVDLHGLAADGRPGIVAHRPAPVQIGWLGHPGSSAMPALDYVLADAYVLPPELRPHFTEQPLYLPDSAHIDQRHVIGPAHTRTACGLPEHDFVFCSFAGGRRLAPAQFAAWMRILRRVPHSVLWLAADSEPVRDNLRVAALRHGVASDRLVFAARVPAAQHLARLQLADLCLDTFPLSGGAHAGDALWAGVPLLSRAGDSYAGRLGGSLLHALGLPELVARSARGYEDKAVRLAGRPEELARLRRRLARSRDRGGPFDTPKLARQLEQLYLQVARGSLLGDADTLTAAGVGADGGVASDAPAPTLPLVSILIPAGDADSAEALERTVRGALAQDYGRCEIIVSDSAGASRRRAVERLLAALQAEHPRLRCNRAPGLAPADNLDHSLALALGDYVAVAPPGELLHADKISRMMDFYLRYPALGLVACWRQPLAADGAPLPAAPLLPGDTALGGASLAALLLTDERGVGGALCEPAGLLLRRADLGAGFGHYQGRRYASLSGVATLLAALDGRDCAYIAAPLSEHAALQAVAPTTAADAQLDLALERLYLLYEANTRQRYLTEPGRYKALLAQRLQALSALTTSGHAALAGAAPARRDALQQALRQGYHLLLE